MCSEAAGGKGLSLPRKKISLCPQSRAEQPNAWQEAPLSCHPLGTLS